MAARYAAEPMAIDELPERGVIPLFGSCHQIGVGHTGNRHRQGANGWVSGQ